MAIVATVMAGLRQLPTNAIPETLDIVMQATGVNPVTLLSSLLRSAPAEIKEAQVKWRRAFDFFLFLKFCIIVREISIQSRQLRMRSCLLSCAIFLEFVVQIMIDSGPSSNIYFCNS